MYHGIWFHLLLGFGEFGECNGEYSAPAGADGHHELGPRYD